jgi:hypothetical protein
MTPAFGAELKRFFKSTFSYLISQSFTARRALRGTN